MVVNVDIVGKVKEVLLTSNKRHRVIVGGRGKGASWSIARILLLRGMAKERFIPCIREVQKTIQDSVKKILSDTIKTYLSRCRRILYDQSKGMCLGRA